MSKKIAKPRYTLSMSIAASHNSSRQLSGWIAANGYKLAIGLSIISVVIGTCVGFVNRFAPIDPSKGITPQNGLASGISIFFGLLIGGIAAILFENLTVGSIKRLKGIPYVRGSWKARFPNYAAVCMGVFMSVLGGDQMWSLAFSDWRALVFALAISFTLIFTEIYDHEHDTAVKTSVQRSDVTAIALQEEMNEQLEQILRQQNYAMLSEPTFIASIQEHARMGLEQVIKSRYAAMLPSTSDVPQIAARVTIEPVNDDVKLLPSPVQPLAEIVELHPDVHTMISLPLFVQNTDSLPEPTLDEKRQATVRLWNAIVGPNVTQPTPEEKLDTELDEKSVKSETLENVPNVKFSSSNELEASTDDLTLELPENIEDESTQNLTHTTDPLPVVELPESVKETVKVRKPKTVKAPVQNPTSANARKIKAAQAKLVKQGVKPTKTAIAQLAGVSRQTVTEHFKKMAIAEEV